MAKDSSVGRGRLWEESSRLLGTRPTKVISKRVHDRLAFCHSNSIHLLYHLIFCLL